MGLDHLRNTPDAMASAWREGLSAEQFKFFDATINIPAFYTDSQGNNPTSTNFGVNVAPDILLQGVVKAQGA